MSRISILGIVCASAAVTGCGMIMQKDLQGTTQSATETPSGGTPTGTPTSTPSGSPTPGAVSFSMTILPTLQSNCVSCHNGGGGLTPLNSYANVITIVTAGQPNNSQLYTKINGGSMSGYSPSGFATKVGSWITAGAPNN